MELRHLRYFLAVAETGSFRGAADRSFVAQSALSAQIARLEDELDNRLFFRTTRTVRLTPAGEVLVPLARRIVADVERASEEMAALAGLQRGHLRLGIIQTGARAIDLIALVASFHAQHPGIDLSVRNGASRELAAAVGGGDLDVSFVALPESELPPGLAYRSIVDDPLVAVTSRTAARGLGAEVGLGELLERGPFIQYRRGSGLRHSVHAGFERAGLTAPGKLELDQISEMIRLAAIDGGVTIVPESSVRPIDGEPRHTAAFAVRPLADREMVHAIGLVHDPQRLGRAGAALLALVPGD